MRTLAPPATDAAATPGCNEPRTTLPVTAARRSAPLPQLWLAGLLLAGAFGFSACQILPEPQPDPTRYFLLRAPVTPVTPKPDGLIVGLRGIELPAYLRNSRSLVVARGRNEIAYRDFDRWAEPLDAGLSRVVREALLATEAVSRVNVFPFGAEAAEHDYEIALRVLRCEGAETADEGRAARFAVAYQILRGRSGGEVVTQGTFVAPEAAWNGDADALAVLLGEAAAEAARAIAQELPPAAP